MYKADLLLYIEKSTNLDKRQGGNGAINLLAEILEVTPSTISQFKEIIPIRRAMQLNKFFSDKDKRKEYGLPGKPPKLDIGLYE